MRYFCFICTDETADLNPGDPGWDELMADYAAFSAAVREAGVYVDGDPLQPTSTATTARVREGEVLLTDGPFAETREQVGGYYLLECKDLDEALAWAAKIPSARRGCIEVRPVLPLG